MTDNTLGTDLQEVAKRLAVVLEKERQEAIEYAVLTVLCTPVFVALAGVVFFLVFVFVFRQTDYDMGAYAIYTGFNIFLAYMIVFVLRQSNPPEEPRDFDKGWLAAVGLFLILLILTYATGFCEKFPVFFGIVYAILGFLVLGLLGSVQMACCRGYRPSQCFCVTGPCGFRFYSNVVWRDYV